MTHLTQISPSFSGFLSGFLQCLHDTNWKWEIPQWMLVTCCVARKGIRLIVGSLNNHLQHHVLGVSANVNLDWSFINFLLFVACTNSQIFSLGKTQLNFGGPKRKIKTFDKEAKTSLTFRQKFTPHEILTRHKKRVSSDNFTIFHSSSRKTKENLLFLSLSLSFLRQEAKL